MTVRKLVSLLTLLFLFSACGFPTPTPAPTLTPILRVTLAATTAPPPTAEVSATPAPSATPEVQLVGYAAVGDGTPGVRAALDRAASTHGWQVQAGPDVAALAQAGVLLVVADGAELEAATRDAAAAFPDTYFIGLNQAGTEPALPNLLTLGGPNPREDQAGFAAGLIAGYVTNFQVVTAVANTATVTGLKYRNGFLHGVRYSCTRCRVDFVDLTDETATQFAAEQAQVHASLSSDVIFAAAGAAGMAGVRAAAQAGAWVIGGGGDAYALAFDNGSAAGADRLITSVYFDPAVGAATGLSAALEAYAAGTPQTGSQPWSVANGAVVILPYRVGPEVLSELDQQDVLEALALLADGSLETGVDPLTGDER